MNQPFNKSYFCTTTTTSCRPPPPPHPTTTSTCLSTLQLNRYSTRTSVPTKPTTPQQPNTGVLVPLLQKQRPSTPAGARARARARSGARAYPGSPPRTRGGVRALATPGYDCYDGGGGQSLSIGCCCWRLLSALCEIGRFAALFERYQKRGRWMRLVN